MSNSNHSGDKQNFRLVNEAMKTSNFDELLVKTIWRCVASVIHLGNVKFVSTDSSSNTNGPDENQVAGLAPDSLNNEIKNVSRMLELDENELVKALTSRLIASGSKELVTKNVL